MDNMHILTLMCWNYICDSDKNQHNSWVVSQVLPQRLFHHNLLTAVFILHFMLSTVFFFFSNAVCCHTLWEQVFEARYVLFLRFLITSIKCPVRCSSHPCKEVQMKYCSCEMKQLEGLQKMCKNADSVALAATKWNSPSFCSSSRVSEYGAL